MMRPLHHPPSRPTPLAAALAALALPLAAAAQTATVAPPVVVTATRVEQASFDLPLAVDSIDANVIQGQRPQVAVGETLVRVPGTAIQNRETFSQEQQIVIRGFGARSQFGVRGIKVLADGIPASTPDGQGGTGLFDLASARRIEVLRGPFSALYGNHSGGVVQLFTEDGPAEPTLTASLLAGSYGTQRLGFKLGGQHGALNYIASASAFDTDGYRQWSSARKEQANVKLSYRPDEHSRWMLLANSLNQPDNRDPLGLTAAQLAADRRQAQPVALTFQTRRNLDNLQGGLAYERALGGGNELRAMAYAGTRSNEQYLAIPLFVQNAATHSGGVSAFDREFWGAGLRWTRRREASTLTLGVDYERADDDRKGYLNNNGTRGALKRDEVNAVWQAGVYAQGEWRLDARWSLSAGLRYTRVAFRSNDRYIAAGNPDDSGSAAYSDWTPVAGVLFKASDTVNLYANAGRSFEAPTFIELAYRDNNLTGLNFDLKPSTSNHYELGAKAFIGSDTRLTAALFEIRTGNEIVVSQNAGGRTTYRNAGRTGRRGVEFAIDTVLGRGFAVYAAATVLDARFKDALSATVPAGNRIPGVPRHTLYAELTWQQPALGFTGGIELRRNGQVWADDANTASAEAYTVANLRAGFEQRFGPWQLTEYLRLDNVTDRRYVGAVYVNDGNTRYFAPAAERSALVGVSAAYRF